MSLEGRLGGVGEGAGQRGEGEKKRGPGWGRGSWWQHGRWLEGGAAEVAGAWLSRMLAGM